MIDIPPNLRVGEGHMAYELDYYKEHLEHGRAHETNRTAVAALAATISGAIIGELLKHPLTKEDLPYTTTLFAVGLVGWLLSGKMYERFKLHNAIAKEAREVLDPNLGKLRIKAELAHKKKFWFFYHVPLHWIWSILFVVIAVAGGYLTLKIWLSPTTAYPQIFEGCLGLKQ